jgi:rhodanese-related sulfurtransferase
MTFPAMTLVAVRSALRARTEIALLDVRQESRYAGGHPLFAASFPLGHLEAQAAERLPRRTVPVVVYGDGPDDAAAAARRLRELGYPDVSLLAGGLAGWTADGGELFEDVNAPSKAFGELVAAAAGTPLLPAGEVAALLRGTPPVIVVDARRFDEYATMSIPTAISVPGAELALRVRGLAPDPATTIVVNCAGRTRSIIGAQSLINAGLPNRVVALANGTIGWTLAGLDLDHGQARRAPGVSGETAAQAEAAAWPVADLAGVRRLDEGESPTADDGTRTVYRFDVRTPQEYENGHRPGFQSAPGGQLVQETDWYAPVRGALIILAGDGGGRAALTGSWLAQMGWEVAVTAAGPAAPPEAVSGALPEAASGALPEAVSGALPEAVSGALPEAASGELPEAARVLALAGGTQGWARSGRALASGRGELLSPALDVYRRPYEGTGVDPAVMQAYLDWEYGLVAQLGRDGTHGFRVLTREHGLTTGWPTGSAG